MSKQYYLCTRPRLASMLIERGEKATATKNPFARDDTHRQAWDIELTPNAASIISGYFVKINKPIPKAVEAYIMAGGQNG